MKVNGELVLRKKTRQPVRENERKRDTPRDEANREIETGEKWHQLPVLKNPFQVPLDDKRLHLQKHIEHIDDEKGIIPLQLIRHIIYQLQTRTKYRNTRLPHSNTSVPVNRLNP